MTHKKVHYVDFSIQMEPVVYSQQNNGNDENIKKLKIKKLCKISHNDLKNHPNEDPLSNRSINTSISINNSNSINDINDINNTGINNSNSINTNGNSINTNGVVNDNNYILDDDEAERRNNAFLFFNREELMTTFIEKKDFFSGKSIRCNTSITPRCNSLFIRKYPGGVYVKTEAFFQIRDRKPRQKSLIYCEKTIYF